MKKMKLFALLAAAAAVALVMSACGALPETTDLSILPLENDSGIVLLRANPGTVPVPTPLPTATVPETQPAKKDLTLEDAKQLVFEKLGITEDQITGKKFEKKPGKFELEFQVGDTEYEFTVIAATGEITEVSREVKPQTPAAPTKPEPAPKAELTLEQAKQLVFEKLGITEDQVTHKDFDYEFGRYELEFRIGNIEYEFEVDAATGTIIKGEWEYEDDD